ncbi:hypothetical protein CBR_g8993 [Chara braunii]|uniref:Protein ENHANCED DISEASE RESISTANCE 2 C-terminal domain-containing protein n=1 Tax=Chara braunii TaxID=69332 RepID=A0A388KNG7_CHABU|nr:hypothetical protein CBR_g8993 [Chara braunii]|eukprot:GBG71577.1 hypothetical protein CBR_g8993 [Chara braunii]
MGDKYLGCYNEWLYVVICTVSTVHADCRPKKGYRRLNMSLGVWEISPLPKRSGDTQVRSLVTQMMELKLPFLRRLRGTGLAKFYKTHTYLLLSRISGLREYFAACGNLCKEDRGPSKTKKKVEGERAMVSARIIRDEDSREAIGFSEEFYDAMDTMAQQSATDDESDSESINPSAANARAKLRQSAWGLRFFLHISSKHKVDDSGSEQLLHGYSPISFDPSRFKGSVPQARHAKETNCWDDPGGEQFVVRGKNYLQDCVKVRGERPLLTLLAVDWFKDSERMDNLASRPGSIVQVPGPEHHSLVFYFASEKPVRPASLLDRFISGDDTFRNERFKLIPRIVEGYWVVKRAVGTKAVLLGKAVTCSYYCQDNYLEIDVDIGSSSVARSIIGLVLGYVECLTVDMAIVIQGEEESELPEYILASMRIMHLKLDSATPPPPAR